MTVLLINIANKPATVQIAPPTGRQCNARDEYHTGPGPDCADPPTITVNGKVLQFAANNSAMLPEIVPVHVEGCGSAIRVAAKAFVFVVMQLDE